MPAEYYHFKPNPEQMSFGQQMIHIAGAQVYRFAQLTGTQPPFTEWPKAENHPRANGQTLQGRLERPPRSERPPDDPDYTF